MLASGRIALMDTRPYGAFKLAFGLYWHLTFVAIWKKRSLKNKNKKSIEKNDIGGL